MTLFFKLFLAIPFFALTFSGGYCTEYEVFNKSGKVGLRDEEGTVIIPATYENLGWSNGLIEPQNGVIGFKQGALWGIISLENKKIISATYLRLKPFNDRLFIASKLGKVSKSQYYGLINSSGKVAVPFRYFSIQNSRVGAIVSKKEGNRLKYGLVNLNGSELIPARFKDILSVADLIAVSNFEDKVALFDYTGKALSNFIYSSAEELTAKFTVVRREHTYGLLSNGKFILPAEFKKIYQNNGEIYSIPFDEWQVLTNNNQILKTYTHDQLMPLSQGYLVHSNQQTWLMDTNEKPATDPGNDTLIFQHNNFISFKRDKGWGLLNSNYDMVIPPKHDSLYVDADLIFCRNKQGEWSVYDTLGEKKSRFGYQKIRPKTGYYWAIRRKSHWGFMEQSGKEVIPPVYDHVSHFVFGKTVVGFHGQEGIINKSGRWEVLPTNGKLKLLTDDLYLLTRGSLKTLKSIDDGTIYFTENTIEIKDGYLLETLSDGRVWKVGFNGRIKNRPKNERFKEIRKPTEGLFPVKIDELYGFIDDQNRLVIANRYEDVGNFREGLASFKLMDKWGFIDKKEKIVIQPLYDSVSDFENSVSIALKKNKYYLLSKSGKPINQKGFDRITRLSDNLFLSEYIGYQGVINSAGKMMVNNRYDSLEHLDNGYIIIKKNDKYGLITQHGVDIIPPIYEKLIYDPYRDEYLGMKKSQPQKVEL
ncbi:MAG: WG repeat-containing protein [Bacteroidota bacterium]